MRIFSAQRDLTACHHYRLETPLQKMADKGLCELAMMYEWQLGSEQALEAALWSDIIVMHRPATEEWFKFIKLVQKYGKIFIADYDDNPFKTSPLNPFYAKIGIEPVQYEWSDGRKEWLWSEDMVSKTGKKIFDIERNIHYRETFRSNFKKADMVSCTTPELAEEFKKINSNTVALPNLIYPEWFPPIPEFCKKEVRICWQGGASHYEDLFFIHPIVVNTLKKHENVKFVFYGDSRFKKLFADCDQNRIEWHGWSAFDAYPYKLSLLNCDIGLCPLIDNEFNRMKSAIKWMEYSMVGMATIASNIPPYSKVISDKNTGFLCNEDEKEWESALGCAIKDKELREKVAIQAKEEVLKNHNIDTKAHLWADAYEAVLNPKTAVI
jgi:glycosyltransferase involved in cell wall biosynthesis